MSKGAMRVLLVLLAVTVAPVSARTAMDCIQHSEYKFRNLCSKNVIVRWCTSEPIEGYNHAQGTLCGATASYYGHGANLPPRSSTPRSGGRAASNGPPASRRSVLSPPEAESGSSAGTQGALGRLLPLPSGGNIRQTLPRSAGLPRRFAPPSGVRWSVIVLGALRARRPPAKLSIWRQGTCGGIAASPGASDPTHSSTRNVIPRRPPLPSTPLNANWLDRD